MKIIDIYLIGDTDASENMTLTSTQDVIGFLEKIEWVDGDFSDGVDGVLSVVETASGVDKTIFTFTDVNVDAEYYPRTLIHGLDKTALTGTAGGDRTKVLVAGKLKLTVTSGGVSKVGGGCIVYIMVN